MKKSNMIAAILVMIISAATFANAQEIRIDFDGRAFNPESMIETVRSVKAAHTGAIGYEKVTPAATQESQPGYDMPGRPDPQFTDKQVEDMNKSIGLAIAYVREHKQGSYLAAGFDCLMRTGTSAQKSAFVNQVKGSVYSFPGGCAVQNKGWAADACKWVVETVCTTVTYVACAIMADGSKECHDEAKEDCKTVKNLVCE